MLVERFEKQNRKRCCAQLQKSAKARVLGTYSVNCKNLCCICYPATKTYRNGQSKKKRIPINV